MQRSLCLLAALGLISCGSSSGSDNGGSGGATSTGGATAGGGGSGNGGSAAAAGAGGSSSQLQTGAPCTNDTQCAGIDGLAGTCMKDWPGGGACTIVGCSIDCPGNGSWCTLDKTGHKTYCAPACQPGIIPCARQGYVCNPSGGCLPPDVGGVVGGDN